ncbi:MAG: nucleoside-diphosphate kinase [Patescibacteria group bacterium]
MSKERVISYVGNEYLSGNHGEYTIAMIKPDGVAIHLMHEFADELCKSKLSVDFCFPVQLRKETIYEAFKILREPSEFTDNWQEDVAIALSAGPSLIYIISGDNAVEKVLKIKRCIREKYLDRTQYAQRVLQNLLHSSDSKDEASEELTALVKDTNYAQILLASSIVSENLEERIIQEGDEAIIKLLLSGLLSLKNENIAIISQILESHWFRSYQQIIEKIEDL